MAKTPTKKEREIIFNKFGGRCAYCGNELPEKGWHVDEIKPVRRNYYYDRGKGKFMQSKKNPMRHPERMHIDNQFPACPPCNINKHDFSLEEFRKAILGYMKHLNERSTQYKMAKRYGLVNEAISPIVFYFEKFQSQNPS